MKKPWEETWRAEFDEGGGYDCMTDAYLVRQENGACLAVIDTCGRGENEALAARARLAACAPEMARMLLKLEYDSEENFCPACYSRPGHPKRTVKGSRTEWTKDGLKVHPLEWVEPAVPGHESDCELDALLRKAGVR